MRRHRYQVTSRGLWGSLAAVLSVGVVVASCGGSAQSAAEAVDAGDIPVAHPDSGFSDVVDMSDARIDRLTPHDGEILANMHLRVVYIGEEGIDGPPGVDDFVTWLFPSDYWGILQEYYVKAGTFDGSIRIPTSSVFLPGMVQNQLVDYQVLDARILEILHPGLGDGGSADDAALDGGIDSGADGGSLIPKSQAYLFLLPDNVNVGLGGTTQTCIQAGGYHSHDGLEPYAIIPPCRFGRSAMTISHELAEMATDPLPQYGWFSDDDFKNAGGEVGDLCNVPIGVDGWTVTQLWSNKNGACIPAF